MHSKTIAEKILSQKARLDVAAGDIVVCDVDLVLGTDASAPMAIDYFERMGADHLFDPGRVVFALDHYSPPTSVSTVAFHRRVHEFARRHGARVHEVGEGISHQIMTELGRALPGELVVGADSHTVTCGALNAFATGVGSSDLAAAMMTGQTWLRVPESIRMTLVGTRRPGVAAKDVALAMVARLGADGANYRALEFDGAGVADLTLEDRLVLSNMAVEAGAKAAIFTADDRTYGYLDRRASGRGTPTTPDSGARYALEATIDLSMVQPQVALPHRPDNVVLLMEAAGIPVHMVFVGTCTGGRVPDLHEVLAVIERGGGRLAAGVQLVVTPASREVQQRLTADGTLHKLEAMGAILTTPGCGACCGTSGVIPGDDMNVLSTANRNFKARMGNGTASIYLASPAACAAAAVTGKIADPRSVGA